MAAFWDAELAGGQDDQNTAINSPGGWPKFDEEDADDGQDSSQEGQGAEQEAGVDQQEPQAKRARTKTAIICPMCLGNSSQKKWFAVTVIGSKAGVGEILQPSSLLCWECGYAIESRQGRRGGRRPFFYCSEVEGVLCRIIVCNQGLRMRFAKRSFTWSTL
jgi:hypothetical protein